MQRYRDLLLLFSRRRHREGAINSISMSESYSSAIYIFYACSNFPGTKAQMLSKQRVISRSLQLHDTQLGMYWDLSRKSLMREKRRIR